jgi:hypothetical protein
MVHAVINNGAADVVAAGCALGGRNDSSANVDLVHAMVTLTSYHKFFIQRTESDLDR